MTTHPPADSAAWPVKRVLDRIHDACLLFDSRLDCVYANKQACDLFALALEHLLARSLNSHFPTTIGSEFQRAALSAFTSGRVARRMLWDESTGRWLEAMVHPSSEGLFAIICDVTSQKCADLERGARTELLEQLLDQIPAFVWVIDRDLIVRRIEGGRSMLEALDRDQLIGLPQKTVTEMGCNAEDTELSLEMHRRALKGVPGRYRATWKGITLEARIRPLHARDGKIDGIVGVGIDVTEQTRMEEQLRGSEERFRAVVEGSADLIAILDDRLLVRYASPSHGKVLGYRMPHGQTIDPWPLVHPDDIEYAREQLATLERRSSLRMDRPVRVRTKRGEWKSFAITLTDLRRYEAIRGVVVNARDVTKELALELQLRQSQKLEALGQLAAGVAHDFNNVLAAIDGFAQLLYEDLRADDSRRHDVDEILKAANRGARITHQLLAFSRRQVPAATRINLVALVHELSRMLRALLPATIALRVSPEPDAPSIDVFADRSQLEQVIVNLTVNARDAMPTGGTVSIDVRAETTPHRAHTAILQVRDSGTGMSPEVQARVFEPFFTTKEPGRGTGLGLATVYGIVRQHSGSIDIASNLGEGTTVTVLLPMAAKETDLVPDKVQSVARDQVGRVLVVEDEAPVREVVARFLQRAGYDVQTAPDAVTALESLTKAGPFDLVLTDSAMPDLRGEELALEIARMQPQLPVILMSGYTDVERPQAPSILAAVIQKPFTASALLAEVRRLIARDRASSN